MSVCKGRKSGDRSQAIYDIERLSNFRFVRGVQTYTVHWTEGPPSEEPATNLNHHAVWIFWEQNVEITSLVAFVRSGQRLQYGFETGNFIQYRERTLARIDNGTPNPFVPEPFEDDTDENIG